MKRRGFLFAMISALSLVGLACGRAAPNGQVLATQSNVTKSATTIADESAGALSMGAKATAASTSGPVSNRFNLALRDWSGQVGEFAKTKDRANRVTTLRLPYGAMFVGEIDNQEMDGWGILTQPTGTREEGEWRHGQPYHVSGVYVSTDGTREEGTWSNTGTASGGTITWKDGRTYKGEWKPVTGAVDLPDGMGTMTWPDGRTYTGHFRDGQMDGTGKMTHPDGKIEDGTWKQGKFVGAGLAP